MPAPIQPQPIGSPDDIIVYNGRPHSRYYALARFAEARVPAGWVERTMAEAPVIFAQPETGRPVFFERAKPCHDEKGWFAPCDGEAAEKSEKVRAEKKEAKAKEKEEKAKKKDTETKLKAAAKDVRAIAKEKSFPPPKGTTILSGPPTPERSRVGVPGNVVPPPPARIPRLPNLTADERYAEDRFATAFERNPDDLAKEFTARTLKAQADEIAEKRAKQKEKGKPEDYTTCPTFETDAAKMLSGDYNPGKSASAEENLDAKGVYNAAVHQTANAIAKRAFVAYLDKIAEGPEDKKRVLVTSGGCGSGKGYAVDKALGAITSQVGACWDAAGEQNATENQWIMDECKKRGIRPTYVFVHADPSTSWEDPDGGVITRAQGNPDAKPFPLKPKGRMVDARLFADSYTEGAKNFKAFMDKHKDSGEADFVCIDNSVRGTLPNGDPILPKKVDGFPEAALKFDNEKLYARSANYVASVTNLKPAVRRGASVGRRIWGQPSEDATAPKPRKKKAK